MEETGTAKVVVRLRPINERENKLGGPRPWLLHPLTKDVFEGTLCPIHIDVLDQYESTVFAYGQTGTGKTYTMIGDLLSPDLHGIIPRSACSIFDTLSQPEYTSHTVTCSYLEINNEELCDLFADEGQRKQTKEIMKGQDGIF